MTEIDNGMIYGVLKWVQADVKEGQGANATDLGAIKQHMAGSRRPSSTRMRSWHP